MRIERGTVIADRYVVSAIEKPWLADAPDAGVVCLALDAILDVPVILYAADEDLAGDLKDAGRRLALVNDPRVPSVLDVGAAELEEDRSIVYVVCERTAATSLAEVLSAGPIGPEEARAITGEVSEVLVHAGRRGLHHRCLGPESIGIMADGDVVVHGIAIDAALSEVALGLEVQTDTTALREDALAVVDILYACLSGQWPKPESRAGLAAAPRKNQRVVAIEAFRRDLPEDLTAFLTGITSNSDPGPRSPGEIVRYLREWKRDTLADLEGSPLPDEELFTTESSRADDTADEDDPEAAASAASSGTADDAVSGSISAAAANTSTAPSTAEREPTSTISTSAGAGAVGAKPTANTAPPVKKPAAATSTGAASSTIGMGKTGARPTTTPARPVTPAAPPQRQATPDQIQAALARIGMTRPGTSGYSAGRSDGVATKLDDQLQMREASVFPLSADDLASSDVEEWTPEQTYSQYEDLSAWEYDSNVTAPIVDRDALWGESEDVSTQQMPIIPDLSEYSGGADGAAAANGAASDDTGEAPGATADTVTSPAVQDDSASDDDSSWFLGGVFTTREEEVEQQRVAFERERALERRRAEAARRRVLEAEARTSRQRETSKREAANREAAQGTAASAGSSSRATTATRPVQKESSAAKAAAAGSATGGGSSSQGTAPATPAVTTSTNGSSAAASSSGGAAASAHATSGGSAATGSAAGGGSSPGSGPGTGSRSARERRRITFLVLALLLVVAVVVIGIFAFGGSADDEVQPEAEPTQEAPVDEQEPSEEAEPEGPEPVIVGVEAIDPEGDDEENSDEAENVLPGVQGGWRSERYNSAAFGGLKSGLGLAIELEEESLVSQLDLLAPEGTTLLDVRVGDSDDVDDATTVASVELDGNTTVELNEPATARYVFIWFTEATAEGDGYRVMIDEVDIS
ncbi:protein kinase family protein [Brevibacterium yomogidense]|uniref:hypothetical protein n=1 Tax=Brevibacterium yomogidense TaxID=946573 RepID=UPI0018DF47A6|nr:hypothetical protein [Brevibacterium yomogidense]